MTKRAHERTLLPNLDGVPPAYRAKLIEAIERSLRSYRFFCRFWLGFDPHPGQIMASSPVRKTVVSCGSGWGKSVWGASYLLWEAWRNDGFNLGAFAPTNSQVKLLLEDIGLHVLRGGNKFSLFLGHKPTQSDPYLEVRSSRIWFRNTAYGAEHSRGFEFNGGLMDESAMDKEDTFRLIQSRVRLRPGWIRLASTPKGKGDWFHGQAVAAGEEMVRAEIEGRPTKALFIKGPSHDNPHYDREILEARKEEFGEDSAFWKQEYLGEFVDREGGSFKQADIDQVFDAKWDPEVSPRTGGLYASGWDLAKKGAFTVGTTIAYDRLEDVWGHYRGVKLHRVRGERYGTVFRMIEEREVEWGANNAASSETIIDATGVGNVAEDEIDLNLMPFVFTSKSRGELLFRYITAFGKPQVLRFPRSWTHLYAQHQLHTPKEDAPGQTWDDLDATALSYWLAYERTHFGGGFAFG